MPAPKKLSDILSLGHKLHPGASRKDILTALNVLRQTNQACAYGQKPEICLATQRVITHLKGVLEKSTPKDPIPKPTGRRYKGVRDFMKGEKIPQKIQKLVKEAKKPPAKKKKAA